MKFVHKPSLVIIGLLLLIGGGTVYLKSPKDNKLKQQSIGATHLIGDYQLQIKLDPDKPKIGKNQLVMQIVNGQDQPISDLSIDIFAEMPAMGSMQAMRESISIEHKGEGVYHGRYSLPMNGSWPLSLKLNSNKLGKAEAFFDMNTSRTGVKLMQATPSDLTTPIQSGSISKKPVLASFNVDNYRRQLIGLTTRKVICHNTTKTIYASAKISVNQAKLTDITLKYNAWVGQLSADYIGKKIQQGETLFTVYSPELVSAQDEYLASLQHSHAYGLNKASRKKLLRWGMSPTQVKSLQRRGKILEYLPIISPTNGTIVNKNIITGSAIKAGESALTLVDLSTVWVEGEVFESDLLWIKPDMPVQIRLTDQTEKLYHSTLTFIDSVISPETRSLKVRAELNNADGFLRPGMYAEMQLQIELGPKMMIPEQAVIYSGEQRIVFVDIGNDQLQPTKVTTGIRNNDLIEILEGLKFGDKIVTSGNFLIAAESKLKAGLAQW